MISIKYLRESAACSFFTALPIENQLTVNFGFQPLCLKVSFIESTDCVISENGISGMQYFLTKTQYWYTNSSII